jgi:hypothetical protein
MNIPDATDEAVGDELDCLERLVVLCNQSVRYKPLVPIAMLRVIEVTLVNGRVSMTASSLVA